MENSGPQIGELALELNTVDLYGHSVTLGSDRGKQTLLVFMSVTCPACAALAPALRSIRKSEGTSLEILLVGLGGDEASNKDFVVRHKLESIPYVVSEELAFRYSVSAPPYAILIDEDRVVRAKGVVNQLEHLESLFNAAKLGYPSFESYVRTHYKADLMMTQATLHNEPQLEYKAPD